MTRFLVGTTSVHETAAAADYLTDRLDDLADAGGEVVVVGIAPAAGRDRDGAGSVDGAPADRDALDASPADRDALDAVNVARSRLAAAAPTTETREGDVGEVLAAAVAEHDPDEVLAGPAVAGALGDDADAADGTLLDRLDRPIVVLPAAVE